jgi:Holliday junction resolvase RusA-like endonuclease
MIAFRLPFPPSVNDMYLNNKGKTGRGRIKSPGYRLWETAAGLMLNTQQREEHNLPFTQRVCVEILLNDKTVADSADCDNRIKAVLDLLVTHKVMKKDSKKFMRGVGCEWVDDLKDVECMVLIYPESEI